MLAFLFCFWIDICGNTRRSWLTLFFVSGSIFLGTQGDRDYLYFMFLDRSSFNDAIIKLLPVGIHDWHVCPYSTLRVGWPVPLLYRTDQLSNYCQQNKSLVMKSLFQLYCEIFLVFFSCWTSVLLLWHSSWTMDMINLVNIHIVSTEWEELVEKLKYV